MGIVLHRSIGRRFGPALIGLLMLAGLVQPASSSAQSSPSAYTTGYRYDVLDRLVGTISPDPDGAGSLKYAAVRNSYDSAGRLIKVETGELASWQSETVAPSAWGAAFTVLQTMDTVYDSQGRKVKESLSGGGSVQTVTQYAYDLDTNLICTAVRMNPTGTLPASACTQSSGGTDRIVRNAYDAAGQLVQVRAGVGTAAELAKASYSYTLNGKKDYVIDGEGNRARFVYDGHDRLSQWQFPSNGNSPATFDGSSAANALASAGALSATDFEQYGYDANGNRTSLKKRDGQTLGYTYDNLDRMTAKDLPGTASDVAYTYDLQGRQLSALFPATAKGVTNAYNDFGELTATSTDVGGDEETSTYAYDADGNRTQLTYPGGQLYTFTYDGLDRSKTILQGSSTNLVTIAYDQLGRRASLARGGADTTSYGYDNASRLASLAHDLTSTANDATYSFTYNPASQLATRTINNDAFVWTGYATASPVYTINGLNQYTSVGAAAFAYDLNGNLIADGSNTFTYDPENRLVSAVSASGTATLSYDPLGRLSTITKGSSTTRFIHDGEALIAEYNAAGTLQRRHIHGPGEDEPLVGYQKVGITMVKGFYHADHQGSVIAVTDPSGNLVGSPNRYDAYGIPQRDGSGNNINSGRFQYTGQQWLSEIGPCLYHYKARVYSACIGRFLQTDPVGYDDQINLYAYVGNDPMNKTDWNGEQAQAIAGVGRAIPLAGRACAANTTCMAAVRSVLGKAAASAISRMREREPPSKVNIDTNVLINVLDRPSTTAGINAATALAGRTAVVSPQAAAEYSHGTGSPVDAPAKLGTYLASGAAEMGRAPDPVSVESLMSRGLKPADASVVASGLEQGLKTLTSDQAIGKKVPEYVEEYGPR